MDLEVNEIQIAPFTIWQSGTQQIANVIRFGHLQDYSFKNLICRAHWMLCNVQEIAEVPGGVNAPAIPAQTIKTIITDGMIQIPSTVLSQWINDDTVIYNYIIQQLNLQLAA